MTEIVSWKNPVTELAKFNILLFNFTDEDLKKLKESNCQLNINTENLPKNTTFGFTGFEQLVNNENILSVKYLEHSPSHYLTVFFREEVKDYILPEISFNDDDVNIPSLDFTWHNEGKKVTIEWVSDKPKFELIVDGNKITKTSSPFSFNVTFDKKYIVKLRQIDQFGNTGEFTEHEICIPTPNPPSKVDNLKYTLDDNKATLTWDYTPDKNFKEYRIEIGDKKYTTKKNTFEFECKKDTKVKVFVVNEYNESESNSVSITLKKDVVHDLKYTLDYKKRMVDLTWKYDSEFKQFNVKVSDAYLHTYRTETTEHKLSIPFRKNTDGIIEYKQVALTVTVVPDDEEESKGVIEIYIEPPKPYNLQAHIIEDVCTLTWNVDTDKQPESFKLKWTVENKTSTELISGTVEHFKIENLVENKEYTFHVVSRICNIDSQEAIIHFTYVKKVTPPPPPPVHNKSQVYDVRTVVDLDGTYKIKWRHDDFYLVPSYYIKVGIYPIYEYTAFLEKHPVTRPSTTKREVVIVKKLVDIFTRNSSGKNVELISITPCYDGKTEENEYTGYGQFYKQGLNKIDYTWKSTQYGIQVHTINARITNQPNVLYPHGTTLNVNNDNYFYMINQYDDKWYLHCKVVDNKLITIDPYTLISFKAPKITKVGNDKYKMVVNKNGTEKEYELKRSFSVTKDDQAELISYYEGGQDYSQYYFHV